MPMSAGLYCQPMHLIAVLLCLILPSASAGENAFVVSYGALLYDVDLLSGQAEPIGGTDPCRQISGLASSPDGRIYAIARLGGSDHLCTIDTQTGAGTVVGSLGIPLGSFGPELTIDAITGMFWALSPQGELYRIDGTTGAATSVSALERPSHGIAAWNDQLYVFTEIGNQRYRLESIDPETYALTPLFDLPANTGSPTGAAFDRLGRLWYVGEHGSLLNHRVFGYYRIQDLETGGVVETFGDAFFFGDPRGGMGDLAFLGPVSAVVVPALSPTGLAGLVGLLLASALLLLRAGGHAGRRLRGRDEEIPRPM